MYIFTPTLTVAIATYIRYIKYAKKSNSFITFHCVNSLNSISYYYMKAVMSEKGKLFGGEFVQGVDVLLPWR